MVDLLRTLMLPCPWLESKGIQSTISIFRIDVCSGVQVSEISVLFAAESYWFQFWWF